MDSDWIRIDPNTIKIGFGFLKVGSVYDESGSGLRIKYRI